MNPIILVTIQISWYEQATIRIHIIDFQIVSVSV